MTIKSNKEVKMKTWMIASVVVVLLVVGIFGANALISNYNEKTETSTSTGCGSCNGSCTAESNCGLSSCGAANGGECTCGKVASCNGSCTAENSCGSAGCGAKTGTGCGCNK